MKARVISAFFVFALVTQLSAQKWPTKFVPPQNFGTYAAKETESGFLYETKNYRIEIPKKVDQSLMTNFVMSAEAVAHVLKNIPLPLFSPPVQEKPLIQIALDEESYTAAGGPKGTAGFYSGRSQKVIVRWDQLTRQERPSKLLQGPAFDLLVHELTHLCMHGSLWKMDQWFTEGVAEYLAAAHLGKGRFDFTKIDRLLRDHIQRQTLSDGKSVPLTNIKHLLELSSQDWLNRTAILKPKEALESYTAALLLTHFAFHGGTERRDKVRNYLEKLEHMTSFRDVKPSLFSPSESSEIEKKLKAYWKSRGLQLEFQ